MQQCENVCPNVYSISNYHAATTEIPIIYIFYTYQNTKIIEYIADAATFLVIRLNTMLKFCINHAAVALFLDYTSHASNIFRQHQY